MKRFSLLLLFAITPLFGSELETLETLIETTKTQLGRQEKALELLKEFQAVRTSFLASEDDPRLATRMVRVAMALHETIEQGHLSYVFGQDFLEEIAYFNDMGNLHRIKR